MVARICSRCRTVYKQYNGVNAVELVHDNGTSSSTVYKEFGFCPECMKKVKAFLEEKDEKEN